MDALSIRDFCTLPAADQPMRLMEFDELFRRQVAPPHRIGPYRAEFSFGGADGLHAKVSDLLARESECCSFFDFMIDQQAGHPINGDQLLLQVGVPASRADVLEALLNRALAAIAQAEE
jgi:hypothetical protein